MQQHQIIIFGLACIFTLCPSLRSVHSQEINDIERTPEYANPDARGHNFCAYWKFADGNVIYPSCDPYKMDRCGKAVEFEYKCCPGFQLISERNILKCGSVNAPWTPTIDILNKMAKNKEVSTKFTKKLDNIIQDGKHQTFFVPEDPGSVGFERKFDDDDLIKLHILNKRYLTEDLKDGMELQTENNGATLRVQKYSFGVLCIECMEITNGNIESKSGIIHVVRFPLGSRHFMPKNGRKLTVLKLMNECSCNNQFVKDLPQEMKDKLDTKGDQFYTVMVPQDWEEIRKQYSDDKNILGKIAASHVYDGMICSSAMVKRFSRFRRTANSDGKSQGYNPVSGDVKCEISQNDDDENSLTPGGQKPTQLYSDRNNGKRMMFEQRSLLGDCQQESRLTKTDMTAINGVVHFIEKTLVPLEAMTLEKLMENKKCVEYFKIKKFTDALKECDLRIEKNSKYAILTPQDSSFKWFKEYQQFREEYQRYQDDPEYRCRTVRYHIMRNKGKLDDIAGFNGHTEGFRSNNINNQLYETTYITKSSYGSQLNFHYSPVNDMKTQKLADGYTLYLTPRINVFPERNLTDILATNKDMTIMNGFTEKADIKSKVFDKKAPKNLYLVVKDSGWSDSRWKSTSDKVQTLDESLLKDYLSLHHVNLYLWGGDIGYFKKSSVTEFKSTEGTMLTFWMDENNVMRIGHEDMDRKNWPRVVEYNLPARDGIIWVLEGPLSCADNTCSKIKDRDRMVITASTCTSQLLKGKKGKIRKRKASGSLYRYEPYNKNKCVTMTIMDYTTVRDAVKTMDEV